MHSSFVGLLAILVAAPLTAQDADWMRRPGIVNIRSLYRTIEQAVGDGAYTLSDTTWVCDGGAVQLQVGTARDSTGAVRRLHMRGGTGDSHQSIMYYYDGNERLRFLFATRNAVNGTSEEVRIYWDPAGAVLHRETRTLEGPGWAWGDPEVIRDPVAWLESGCR